MSKAGGDGFRRPGFTSVVLSIYANLTMLAGVMGCFAGFAADARADALGDPEAQGRWGYALSLAWISVDDPDGPTDRAAAPLPLNLVYAYAWREPVRLWMEGFYHDLAVDPSPTQIGQDISRLGGRLLAQRRFDYGGRARLWAGGGLTIARERFTVRQLVDSDGYGTRFADRREFNSGVTLDAVSEWRLNKNWDSAAHLLYDTPIGNGVEELSLSFTFFYTR